MPSCALSWKKKPPMSKELFPIIPHTLWRGRSQWQPVVFSGQQHLKKGLKTVCLKLDFPGLKMKLRRLLVTLKNLCTRKDAGKTEWAKRDFTSPKTHPIISLREKNMALGSNAF